MGIEPTISGLEDQRTSVSASQTWAGVRFRVSGVSLKPSTRNLTPASLAVGVGIEPTLSRLTVERITTLLSHNNFPIIWSLRADSNR